MSREQAQRMAEEGKAIGASPNVTSILEEYANGKISEEQMIPVLVSQTMFALADELMSI